MPGLIFSFMFFFSISGHGGPVRDVVWLSLDDSVGTFASCSHDQIVMLYRWNVSDNSVEAMNACKGHERSVDCLAVAPGAKYLASGSFDTTLKIWGTQIHSEAGGETDEDKDGESESKKAKGNK